MAQQEDETTTALPYFEIPTAPESYSAGNVLSRMIDGLGYRYYWATEGLINENMAYKPSEDGRSLEETITHIYGLSITIINGTKNERNVRAEGWADISLEEKRRLTLENFKKASEALKASSNEDINQYEIIFGTAERESKFPFWNMINGPIADAIYHTGQVVVLRRSAGNPIHPGVNVFSGKTRQ